MIKCLLLATLVLAASSLYTSSYWTNRGINVKDGVLNETAPSITINTVCN